MIHESQDPAAQTRRPAQRHLLTVAQFTKTHPAFTPGGLRWLLFNRETNGLQAAVVRIGRRVLIDEDCFFQWLDEQNPEGAHGHRM